MSWAAAPVTIIIACVFAYSIVADTPEAVASGTISAERYYRAMACTGLAVVIALLSEPMFVLAQAQLRTSARTRIETWAVMGKCVAVVAGTVGFGLTIEAFAIANIVYALLVLFGYLALFTGCGTCCSGGERSGIVGRRKLDGIPRPMRLSDGKSAWDPVLIRTARMFWWQSAQKWLLENGEKVLDFCRDRRAAGCIRSRVGLGSIVVRILFQPKEEMSLAAFGKLDGFREGLAEKRR